MSEDIKLDLTKYISIPVRTPEGNTEVINIPLSSIFRNADKPDRNLIKIPYEVMEQAFIAYANEHNLNIDDLMIKGDVLE